MPLPPNRQSSYAKSLALIAVGSTLAACPSAGPPAAQPPPRERSVAPAATPVAQPTAAPAPADVARRFPILNGRLTALFPTGSHEGESEDGTPPLDPGQAGSNSLHVVPAGSFEVTVNSFELFARVEADFERQVREGVARWENPPSDYRLEPVATRPPVRALLLTPAAPLPSGLSAELALVCLLYVAHPDGTVQAVEVHAARAAAMTSVLEIAKRIGASLEAGPLPLPNVAGTRTFSAYGARITGEVPDGFVAIDEPGMDFDTLSFVELSPIAMPTRTIAMTVAELGPPSFPGRPVVGRLFGRSTTLYAETTRRLRVLHGKVQVDTVLDGAPLTVNVSVSLSAPTPAGLAGLLAIAENLRWVAPTEVSEEH